MSINYLCHNCSELLKLKGFDVINEVGRKYCEGCGSNEDNLIAVDSNECDKKIKEWNCKYDK